MESCDGDGREGDYILCVHNPTIKNTHWLIKIWISTKGVFSYYVSIALSLIRLHIAYENYGKSKIN
jgi:hypothetical protein